MKTRQKENEELITLVYKNSLHYTFSTLYGTTLVVLLIVFVSFVDGLTLGFYQKIMIVSGFLVLSWTVIDSIIRFWYNNNKIKELIQE